jgi:hypothetical protein
VEVFVAEHKDAFAEDTERASDSEDGQRLAGESVKPLSTAFESYSVKRNAQREDHSTQTGGKHHLDSAIVLFGEDVKV